MGRTDSAKERCRIAAFRSCIANVKSQLRLAALEGARFSELTQSIIESSGDAGLVAAASGRYRLVYGLNVGLLLTVSRIESALRAPDLATAKTAFEDLFREIQCGICVSRVLEGSALSDGASNAAARRSAEMASKMAGHLGRAYLIINDTPGIIPEGNTNGQ